MKKKGVVLSAFLTALMVLLAMSVIVGCGGNAKTVTLTDFDDATVTVDYGAPVYVDNNAVYDTDGNAYAVKAMVTDADGKTIALSNGMFIADDLRGYKIVYSVIDTSVSAKQKTVTVNVKNDGTPAVYFTGQIGEVWSGDEIPVPQYRYTVGPEYTVTNNTLELFSVASAERIKVESFDSAAATVTLKSGDYVFVATVTAGEKTAEAELAFCVKDEAQRYAIASCQSSVKMNVDTDYWTKDGATAAYVPTVAYDTQIKRNAYVSKGSVSIAIPQMAGKVGITVSPEIGGVEFAQRLSDPDTMISVWLYVRGRGGSYRVFSEIDPHLRTSPVTVENETWTNLLLDPDRKTLSGLYNNLCTGTPVFSIAASDDVTVYVDSIYVAEPVAKSNTFADVEATRNQAFTVHAESTSGASFYYSVGGKVNETGEFTSAVGGSIRATAYPVQNRYYGTLTNIVTLGGGAHTFAFAEKTANVKSGLQDVIEVETNGNAAVTYAIEKADGSACYSTVSGQKMRLFEGEHWLIASAEIDAVQYGAVMRLNVAPAPVYDKETLEDFDNPSSTRNIDTDVSYTYVGDYEGKSGVMKFDLNGMSEWPTIGIRKAIADTVWSSYTANDYIAVEAYVQGADTVNTTEMDFQLVYNKQARVPMMNGWHTYYFPVESGFIEENSTGSVQFIISGKQANSQYTVTLYVDRIYAVKRETVTDPATIEDFDHEYAASNVGHLVPYTYLDGYEKKNGVMRFRANDFSTSGTNKMLTICQTNDGRQPLGNANWAEYQYVAVEMYAEGTRIRRRRRRTARGLAHVLFADRKIQRRAWREFVLHGTNRRSDGLHRQNLCGESGNRQSAHGRRLYLRLFRVQCRERRYPLRVARNVCGPRRRIKV